MSLLDTAMQTLSNAMQTGSSFIDDFGAGWQAKMDELKAKAQSFNRIYAELESKRSIAEKDPALFKRYNALLKKGDWIKSIIQSITSGVDFGASLLFGSKPPPVNEMGGLQLVPIAVIVGALSAITYFISDATVQLQEIDLLEKALDKGIDPANIAKARRENIFSSGTELFKFITPVIFLGGIGWLFRDDIKRLLKGRYYGR